MDKWGEVTRSADLRHLDARVRFRDVGQVLDERAVTTVFQPLVRLESYEVVGFEALSRGPVGSPWYAPSALFPAAHAVGRLAELDWMCRALAYQQALRAKLDPSIALFVNTEPRALGTECPPDLAHWLNPARRNLRVVTEMTERAVAADPSALLAAAATARGGGWGVAFDDVGADPASLALMPFVQPDVVKLDMHLLHHPHRPEVARVVNAVVAYAERTGATILAEGIENKEHVATARSMGATVGQGWLFGRGQRLRQPPVPPAEPLEFVPAPETAPPAGRAGAPTPFEIVSAERATSLSTKRMLLPISQYLETKATDRTEPPVLLSCFQQARYLTPATQRRYTGMADTAALVAVLGADVGEEPIPGVRGAALGPDDRLCGEWNVIVVGPHFAGALVARELGDTGPEPDRRFEYALTYDRTLVLAAARSLLHRVVRAD
jgi:EAL domain-containing protein (putative c-di-GMP-specific phosphodiesterase class I)